MEAPLKRILRGISLALRHELEGWREEDSGTWQAGDLERRLAELGVWRSRPSKPIDEMPHLVREDREARVLVDGYLQLRAEAGVGRDDAVAEFVRESAYTWANRLLALRCMEARSIIDEVILQKPAYAGRSLVHHRFLRKDPDAAAGADDGLFAVLFAEFAARAAELPSLFDPHAAAVALRPSVAALKRCVALLSGTETVRGQVPATDEVFSAPDAFGWAYQYWNTEEKDRVFEAVRTKKGTKIEGADIIPATQLYTEPYMVKFLVQNSLGSLWMALHPGSRLCDGWEYYVRDADRAPVDIPPGGRSVRDFTFLDPALGSGHFHLEAFDLLFAMYREENPALTPREITASILNRNLFGIDLDERAVQIADAALWMKAKDAAPELEATDLDTFHDHLVATNIRLPRGRDHLEAFLRRHPEDTPLRPAIELVLSGLEHADELGSLLQIEEPVDRELRRLKDEANAAGTTPSVQPDMFRAAAVQSTLPLGVESYEAWKAGALHRLKAHFEQEAEAADSVRAFFGASARKGLALFDLLARRYDVVAANPPYMGSANMGETLKSFILSHFPDAKRDLYAAFLVTGYGKCSREGFIAMVTPDTWTNRVQLKDLRSSLMAENQLRRFVALGRHAFEEADPPGLQCMFVFRAVPTTTESSFRSQSTFGAGRSAEQRDFLLAQVRSWNSTQKGFWTTKHSEIAKVPNEVLLASSGPIIADLLKDTVSAQALGAGRGLSTGDNPRFMRLWWEVPADSWNESIPLYKSAGYAGLLAPRLYRTRWRNNGADVREMRGARLQNLHLLQRKSGLLVLVGSKCGVINAFTCDEPVVPHDSCFFVPADKEKALAAVQFASSRIGAAFFRLIYRGQFAVTTLDFVPAKALSLPVQAAFLFRLQLQRSFAPSAMVSPHYNEWTDATTIGICEVIAEQLVEQEICNSLGLGSETHILYQEIPPPAWGFPLISDYDELPTLPVVCGNIPQQFVERFRGLPRTTLAERDLANLKRRIRGLFESLASSDQPDEEDANEDAAEDDAEQTQVVVPAQSYLETIATAVGVHPLSVFRLVKEGEEEGGWRCLPEEKRLTEERFTVLALRMLGHRWPNQIEAGEPLPEWADRDGVIPISRGSTEPALADRMLDLLSVEFPGGDPTVIGAQFEEIVGTPLEAWLAGSFFERHISQFRKRPIAWQLQIEPGRRRSSPARAPVFACLVYYHRLDSDLLPKLRSHYLAVLRTAHETELRTLEALSQPTPDQATRKVELELLVDELNCLDSRLQAVVETGFGPAPLQPRLRQLAVDDAMLAMKARWLTRLRDTLQVATVAEWLTAATDLGHHTDFAGWIAAAMAHLPHHCAKAGARSPDAATLFEDPTPTTLATVICAETAAMTATALDRVCAEWKHEWDTHAIDPLRARISATNSALEALAAELETLDSRNTTRVVEIAREQKRLRAEVKTLKAEIKAKTEQAGHLAERIRRWTSPELATWEPWLASGPLFDDISSLDGRRPVPATIRDFIQQESLYAPDLNDGVRVNIAPLQRAGVLAADVLAAKDLDKAIADRAEWRADERRWVREGKLPQPGWWPTNDTEAAP